MKKNDLLRFAVTAFLIILGVSAMFTSCSKGATDENGFCVDGKSAMEKAEKENKNILIIATMKEEDLFSSDLMNKVLKDSRFNKEIGSQYVVLLMDFSKASYEATIVNEEQTKAERKEAETKADIMQHNTLLASRLNLEVTPAIYITTKEMYFITQLDYLTEQITDYDKFKSMLDDQERTIRDFNEKTAKIEMGTGADKLAAIDELYESTDTYYRTFLLDLIKEYIELDADNKSGLLSKYLLSKADIESSEYFLSGDIGNAVKSYADVAEDIRLSPEHRQNAYYLAAYIMVWGQSADFETIKDYLQKAIAAYPEGPNTSSIEQALEQIDQILSKNLPAEEEGEDQTAEEQ